MAFTNTEKVSIRSIMCATKRFLDFSAAYYPLENAMDIIGADTETSALVRAALAKIDLIETQMSDLQELVYIEKAEENTLKAAQGFALLRSEGRRHIRKIANALGLDPLDDYFSAPKLDGAI